MSTIVAVCPFSKTVCRECAIYRGRHVELCTFSRNRSNGTKTDKAKARGDEVFTKWEMPDLADCSTMMVNIEDFIERRGI